MRIHLDIVAFSRFAVNYRSGTYYQTVADVEPLHIPGWVCDWIERHSPPPKPSRCEGAYPVSEDFDFDGFCEHYGITISHVRDGVWHVVEECPGVGYRHEQSTLAAFYYDGNTLGWSCFARECPTHGMAIGQLVGFLSREHGRYPGVIWDPEGDEGFLAALGVETLDNGCEAEPASGPEAPDCPSCDSLSGVDAHSPVAPLSAPV